MASNSYYDVKMVVYWRHRSVGEQCCQPANCPAGGVEAGWFLSTKRHKIYFIQLMVQGAYRRVDGVVRNEMFLRIFAAKSVSTAWAAVAWQAVWNIAN